MVAVGGARTTHPAAGSFPRGFPPRNAEMVRGTGGCKRVSCRIPAHTAPMADHTTELTGTATAAHPTHPVHSPVTYSNPALRLSMIPKVTFLIGPRRQTPPRGIQHPRSGCVGKSTLLFASPLLPLNTAFCRPMTGGVVDPPAPGLRVGLKETSLFSPKNCKFKLLGANLFRAQLSGANSVCRRRIRSSRLPRY